MKRDTAVRTLPLNRSERRCIFLAISFLALQMLLVISFLLPTNPQIEIPSEWEIEIEQGNLLFASDKTTTSNYLHCVLNTQLEMDMLEQVQIRY